jgi:hypothetical protein
MRNKELALVTIVAVVAIVAILILISNAPHEAITNEQASQQNVVGLASGQGGEQQVNAEIHVKTQKTSYQAGEEVRLI